MEIFKENLNPKNRKVGDCVIRALSAATGYTWDEVLDKLIIICHKVKDMPNSKRVYEKFLIQEGWIKQKMPRRSDNTRYTVKEFLDEILGPDEQKSIISVANHLTYAEGNTLIDTWDCSYKSVGNFWIRS